MLSPLEQEFASYAKSFFTSDETVTRNLRLKLAHSFRVRNEMAKLVEVEGFSPDETCLALRAALLHDLSRFEQYSRFRTFKDLDSFDHGERSAELAVSLHMIDDLADDEQADVLTAIRAHNKLRIPVGITPRANLLAKAIRDADKLDILPILLGYLKDPENKSIVFGLDPEPELSPVVRDTLLRGETPNHRDMRTVCDFLAGKLLWTHDLNFGWTRREFRRRGYIEELMKSMPDTPLFRRICEIAMRPLLSA